MASSVPKPQPIDMSKTVVVGVDGSENGRRALTWALDEARMRDMRCMLVHSVDLAVASATPFVGSSAFEALPEAAGRSSTMSWNSPGPAASPSRVASGPARPLKRCWMPPVALECSWSAVAATADSWA